MKQKVTRQHKRKTWSETWKSIKDQAGARSEKRRLFKKSWEDNVGGQIVIDGHSKETERVIQNDVKYQEKKEYRNRMKMLFPKFWK